MKKQFAATLITLSILSPSAAYAGNWAIGITGGGNEPLGDFFVNGVNGFSNAISSMSIPANHTNDLYGGGGYQFYQIGDPTFLDQEDADADRLIKSSPTDCSLANRIYQLESNSAPQVYVGNDNFARLFAPNNIARLKEQLDTAIEKHPGVSTSKLLKPILSPVVGDNNSVYELLANAVSTGTPVNVKNVGSTLSSNITGDTSFKNLDQVLNDRLAKIQPGDHILLSITDHGAKIEGSPTTWQIALDADRFIDDIAVQTILAQFEAKGAIVHLYTNACYDGGFEHLTLPSTPKQPGACVITKSDKDLIGWSSGIDFAFFPALAKKHNTLSAFACALAQDDMNHPSTSLDVIVHDWESHLDPTHQPCSNGTGVEDLKTQVDSLDKAVTEPFRKDLIDAYQELFANPYAACLPPPKPTGPTPNEKLLACLKSSNLDADTQAYLSASYKSPSGDKYRFSLTSCVF
jgi:hypothetical protein